MIMSGCGDDQPVDHGDEEVEIEGAGLAHSREYLLKGKNALSDK